MTTTYERIYITMLPVYERIARNLHVELVKTFPRSLIYIHGSRELRTASLESPIDIYIDTGLTFYKSPPSNRLLENLLQIEAALRKFENFSNFEILMCKRGTPILKVFEKTNKLFYMLRFGNGLGLRCSNLLQFFASINPIARRLTIFVVFWAKLAGLEMSGYLISLLVVFYLQMFSMLPSVQLLQLNMPEINVDGKLK